MNATHFFIQGKAPELRTIEERGGVIIREAKSATRVKAEVLRKEFIKDFWK
jgi:hypothetical protein